MTISHKGACLIASNNGNHTTHEVCVKAIEYAKQGNEQLVLACGHIVLQRIIDAARAENQRLTTRSIGLHKPKELESLLQQHFSRSPCHVSGSR